MPINGGDIFTLLDAVSPAIFKKFPSIRVIKKLRADNPTAEYGHNTLALIRFSGDLLFRSQNVKGTFLRTGFDVWVPIGDHSRLSGLSRNTHGAIRFPSSTGTSSDHPAACNKPNYQSPRLVQRRWGEPTC